MSIWAAAICGIAGLLVAFAPNFRASHVPVIEGDEIKRRAQLSTLRLWKVTTSALALLAAVLLVFDELWFGSLMASTTLFGLSMVAFVKHKLTNGA
ncbi:hypothetical protein [Nocardioides kribbensis]|uniref:hypothetical protein n=1 Tax=Nocardioides kribbensis TaxID=305517 RepID=UPI001879D299|nr:hypothetical protein [Nocardioides kribbensis]